MAKSADSALVSPAARRLAAKMRRSVLLPPKMRTLVAKADATVARRGFLYGAAALLVTTCAAYALSSLTVQGPSPTRTDIASGANVPALEPAPLSTPVAAAVSADAPTEPVKSATPPKVPVQTLNRQASATETGIEPTPLASKELSSKPASQPVQIAAASPAATSAAVHNSAPLVISDQVPQLELIDPSKIVAPITLKLQSLDERLNALLAAADAERREAETKAAERLEVERRQAEQQAARLEVDRKEAERKEAEQQAQRLEAERKDAERKEAERRDAERKATEQRLAVLQPQPQPIARPARKDCLGAVEAAAQAVIVPFDTGSADISPVHTEQLKRFAKILEGCPEAMIEVSGHTDAKGALENNFSLSWRRAEAVISAFTSLGLENARFTAVGYGTRSPISRTTETENPIDRRVELKLR